MPEGSKAEAASVSLKEKFLLWMELTLLWEEILHQAVLHGTTHMPGVWHAFSFFNLKVVYSDCPENPWRLEAAIIMMNFQLVV